jgi:phosphoribosylanthranilate isomerase
MFRIKICGVTNVPDAVHAVDAGADAIGLNFYEKSSRFVEVEQAGNIVLETRKAISGRDEGSGVQVGVFVNKDPAEVTRTIRKIGLTAIQLHGDEPPEVLSHWRGTHVPRLQKIQTILARRMDERGIEPIRQDLLACFAQQAYPNAVLIDAPGALGQYGGSGNTVPWNLLTNYKDWFDASEMTSERGKYYTRSDKDAARSWIKYWSESCRLFLAGGLTPDNVAEAIRIVRPHGVDVASGVESAPGKKDPHKVRDFIAAAKSAFAALGA